MSSMKNKMEYLFELSAKGRLKPVMDKVYPFADTNQALRKMEADYQKLRLKPAFNHNEG